MWTETGFRFTPAFDEVLLGLMQAELRETCEKYIVSRPEQPEQQKASPVFGGLDSLMLTFFLEGPGQGLQSKKFTTLKAWVDFIEHIFSSDRELFFKALNRDVEGNLARFEHKAMPGEPALRIIFDIYGPPRSIPPEVWAETPVRFYLYFRPELQEFFSSDSGFTSPVDGEEL